LVSVACSCSSQAATSLVRANAAPYYRCRFPSEYALANRVHHPLNVTLRQDALLEPLDAWLASKFEPPHLSTTIDELAAATIGQPETPAEEDEINAKIAECDRKLARYRATLDAGADPAIVARWITETGAERAKHQATKRATPQRAAPSMSRDEIVSVVTALSDLLTVLRRADPADKAEIYTQIDLRLTYQPSNRTVRAEAHISSAQHWQFESVRGPSRRLRTCPLSAVNWYSVTRWQADPDRKGRLRPEDRKQRGSNLGHLIRRSVRRVRPAPESVSAGQGPPGGRHGRLSPVPSRQSVRRL
jgi:hypothetical protein